MYLRDFSLNVMYAFIALCTASLIGLLERSCYYFGSKYYFELNVIRKTIDISAGRHYGYRNSQCPERRPILQSVFKEADPTMITTLAKLLTGHLDFKFFGPDQNLVWYELDI